MRCAGVGYMKLGDEMSENGRHFLSTDGGLTFLDDSELQETLSLSDTCMDK